MATFSVIYLSLKWCISKQKGNSFIGKKCRNSIPALKNVVERRSSMSRLNLTTAFWFPRQRASDRDVETDLHVVRLVVWRPHQLREDVRIGRAVFVFQVNQHSHHHLRHSVSSSSSSDRVDSRGVFMSPDTNTLLVLVSNPVMCSVTCSRYEIFFLQHIVRPNSNVVVEGGGSTDEARLEQTPYPFKPH